MCKAQNEGGQRCAAHAKKALAKAERQFSDSGREEDLQALIEAHTQYASTAEGREIVLNRIANGEDGPGELDPAMWERIAADGEALRERNKAVGDAIRAAAAKGDAFHANVQEKMGTYHYVPGGVRSPKALQRFLADQNDRCKGVALTIAEDEQFAATFERLQGEVDTAGINPDAAFEERVPRTEAEAAAWKDRLTGLRARYERDNNARRDMLAEHNERMARFDNPGVSAALDPDRAYGAEGELVRVRYDDGSVSVTEYLVFRTRRNDADADGKNTASLMPLAVTTAAPEGGAPDPGAPHAFRSIVDGPVPEERLVPASQETLAKYGTRVLRLHHDPYVTEVNPRQFHNTVRAWTPADRARDDFDTFRAEWAREHAPYKHETVEAREAAANASLGSRIKGMLSG